jgi:hypothetical protein
LQTAELPVQMLIKRSLERQNVLEQVWKYLCLNLGWNVDVKSTPFEFGQYDSPDCVAQYSTVWRNPSSLSWRLLAAKTYSKSTKYRNSNLWIEVIQRCLPTSVWVDKNSKARGKRASSNRSSRRLVNGVMRRWNGEVSLFVIKGVCLVWRRSTSAYIF